MGPGDTAELEAHIDELLGCGGDPNEANAAAKKIFTGTPPTGDPTQRVTSTDDLDAVLERPWRWLLVVATIASDEGRDILAAKVGLVCWPWNRALIPAIPTIQVGALVAAPPSLEAAIYRPALASLRRLPDATVLGGDWRGDFRAADSTARIACCAPLVVSTWATLGAVMKQRRFTALVFALSPSCSSCGSLVCMMSPGDGHSRPLNCRC